MVGPEMTQDSMKQHSEGGGDTMKRCDCYVDRLPEVMAYALHNGAHEKTCPVFRVSGDPVDRIKDESIRKHYANGCERYEAHNIDECAIRNWRAMLRRGYHIKQMMG